MIFDQDSKVLNRLLDTPHIFTVSLLNQSVRDLLEHEFGRVTVEGELSNLAEPSSGHIYFSLKDAGAQVRCAMFRGRRHFLNFKPASGQHVVLTGKVSLYPDRGDYQLIVESMQLGGDGALQRAFDALNKKLASEGLYDPAHKKPIPAFPKKIGVITSATGAAIRDVLSVLKRRFPALPLIIYPCLVQGAQAAPQIVDALHTANQRAECDVLLLVRGGGTLEDLWPFNEEIVARAIFASHIPIISGIGHEIDFTIADFVADHRAPTPSAAAELASPNIEDYLSFLKQCTQRLSSNMQRVLRELKHQALSLSKRLRHPGQRIHDQMQQLDQIEQRLHRACEVLLQRKQQQFTALGRALHAVSPLSTLDRGYSILTRTHTSEVIESVEQISKNDVLTARLRKGQFQCTVTDILSS